MGNYWRIVNRVIEQADILLEVVDARMVDETRNKEIENKVAKSGKVLIYVINKCDIADPTTLEPLKKSLHPSVFVSATEKLGTSLLRREIMKHAPKERFRVGVLGYPNTGKSSIINALKGKGSAPTSSVSGYTKGVQLIKISQKMYLLDTPGVFPYKEKDEAKHAITAAKTFSNLKDPEAGAMELIEKYPIVARHYGVEPTDDAQETLDAIALKLKKLKKGGMPDTYSAARFILKDWQEGKIK
jgi:ribosome biogenesis GTPase A